MPHGVVQPSRFLTRARPLRMHAWLRKLHPFPCRKLVNLYRSSAVHAPQRTATLDPTIQHESANFFEGLNEEQLSAVLSDKQHIRLVAGPGSGKTRVVVSRIVRLSRSGSSPHGTPGGMMAITFTKRAAEELQERLQLVLPDRKHILTGTFHFIANRYLRRHILMLKCGLSPKFSILNDTQQAALVKYLLTNNKPFSKEDAPKALYEILESSTKEDEDDDEADEAEEMSNGSAFDSKTADPPNSQASKTGTAALQPASLSAIANQLVERFDKLASNVSSTMKRDASGKVVARSGAELLQEAKSVRGSATAEELCMLTHGEEKQLVYMYDRYRAGKRRFNALDFNDIIFLFIALLEHVPKFLRYIKARYRHFLVDEFQDTNVPQYAMLCRMLSQDATLFIVGDANQAIYSWRGAQVDIMETAFEKDFPEGVTMNLTTNYRSVAQVVEFADNIICSDGQPKLHKKLSPARGPLEESVAVRVRGFEEGQQEAYWVAEEILGAVQETGRGYSEVAVLCRTHQMGRGLERAFISKDVPYVLCNSAALWDRVEVKDLMSYLVLAWDLGSDLHLERIINVPTRSLGKVTVEKLGQAAEQKGMSTASFLFQECGQVIFEKDVLKVEEFPGLAKLVALMPPPPFTAKELGISKKAWKGVLELRCVMVVLRSVGAHNDLKHCLEALLEVTMYKDHLKKKCKDDDADRQQRMENIRTLLKLAALRDDAWREGLVETAEDDSGLAQDEDELMKGSGQQGLEQQTSSEVDREEVQKAGGVSPGLDQQSDRESDGMEALAPGQASQKLETQARDLGRKLERLGTVEAAERGVPPASGGGALMLAAESGEAVLVSEQQSNCQKGSIQVAGCGETVRGLEQQSSGQQPQEGPGTEENSEQQQGGAAAQVRTQQELEAKLGVLADFIDWVALKSGAEEDVDKQVDAVKVMTVHAAKGLEFWMVVVPGFEKRNYQCGDEEHKRLAYVATTRPKDRLVVGWAKWRQVFGREVTREPQPSPYLIAAVRSVEGRKGVDVSKSGF